QLRANQQIILLTKNEYLMLKQLIQAEQKMITREELIKTLWKDESFIDENTLNVNISRIRKKLEKIKYDHYLKTIKGLGYMLTEVENEEN
ncbi:MAG: winged helix-turn-helix domain-containing protein, partial [Culicoidibacterales bacterium]